MYADRYSRPGGLNPGGLTLALGTSAVLLFGLSLTAPHFERHFVPTITATNIPLPTDPPPPEHPKPQPSNAPSSAKPRPAEHVDVSPAPVPLPIGEATVVKVDLPQPVDSFPTAGSGAGSAPIPQPRAPVLVQPKIDSRYLGSFQPAYPADERLAEHEGRVVVRVLVGTDGRVKQVEPVSTASPAFLEATRRQALTRWRFTPATRDGVAIEAWREMAVRFQLGVE